MATPVPKTPKIAIKPTDCCNWILDRFSLKNPDQTKINKAGTSNTVKQPAVTASAEISFKYLFKRFTFSA